MGIDEERLELARSRLSGYVDRIESELGEHGYLVGDRFGVADLSVAAVMTAILRPPEFPYPLPEPWPPALVDLRASIAQRTGCRWVADIYRRHRGESWELRPPEV
jgi:glutathione S-transferase